MAHFLGEKSGPFFGQKLLAPTNTGGEGVKSRDRFLGKSCLHQLTQEARGDNFVDKKTYIQKNHYYLTSHPPQVMAKILYLPSYIADLTQILNFDQNALIGVLDLINALTL